MLIRPMLFICFGGCLVLGILLMFAGAGVIIFTQIKISTVILMTTGLVILGLAGLFFELMTQEKKGKNRKGRVCYLFSIFSLLLSFMVGMLWVYFIVHPPVVGDIVSPWFYRNYWWTVFSAAFIWLIFAFYFWQKSASKGGLHF